jgi:hypothetical protein
MKIRQGFVSNSSSSSFILVQKNDGKVENYGDVSMPRMNEMWGHFMTSSEMRKEFGDAFYEDGKIDEFFEHVRYSESYGGYGFGLLRSKYTQEQAHAKITELLGKDLGVPNHVTLGTVYN